MDFSQMFYFIGFGLLFVFLNTMFYRVSLAIYECHMDRRRRIFQRRIINDERPIEQQVEQQVETIVINEENDMKAKVVENPDNSVCVAV